MNEIALSVAARPPTTSSSCGPPFFASALRNSLAYLGHTVEDEEAATDADKDEEDADDGGCVLHTSMRIGRRGEQRDAQLNARRRGKIDDSGRRRTSAGVNPEV